MMHRVKHIRTHSCFPSSSHCSAPTKQLHSMIKQTQANSKHFLLQLHHIGIGLLAFFTHKLYKTSMFVYFFFFFGERPPCLWRKYIMCFHSKLARCKHQTYIPWQNTCFCGLSSTASPCVNNMTFIHKYDALHNSKIWYRTLVKS